VYEHNVYIHTCTHAYIHTHIHTTHTQHIHIGGSSGQCNAGNASKCTPRAQIRTHPESGRIADSSTDDTPTPHKSRTNTGLPWNDLYIKGFYNFYKRLKFRSDVRRYFRRDWVLEVLLYLCISVDNTVRVLNNVSFLRLL
jgi:hypothetical protein